jgi:hypothetical protein
LALGNRDNARASARNIQRLTSPARGDAERREAVTIEMPNEVGDRRPAVQPGLPSRVDECVTLRDRQQRSCPPHLIDLLTAAADNSPHCRSLPLVMRRKGSRCGIGMGSSFPAQYPAKTPAPAIWGMTH